MPVSSAEALGGSAGVFPVIDNRGRQAKVPATVLVDGAGNIAGETSNRLASNQTITANNGSTPVTIARRDIYVWDAQWVGAGTLALQGLASDGQTWRTIATLAAPGTFAGEIRIGAGAVVRLFNQNAAGGAPFTSTYSSLS